MTDELMLEVGWEGGSTAVQIADLDELDDVVRLIADLEEPESDG